MLLAEREAPVKTACPATRTRWVLRRHGAGAGASAPWPGRCAGLIDWPGVGVWHAGSAEWISSPSAIRKVTPAATTTIRGRRMILWCFEPISSCIHKPGAADGHDQGRRRGPATRRRASPKSADKGHNGTAGAREAAGAHRMHTVLARRGRGRPDCVAGRGGGAFLGAACGERLGSPAGRTRRSRLSARVELWYIYLKSPLSKFGLLREHPLNLERYRED